MKNELMIGLLEKLVRHLESLRIAEYMELLERPTKLILINFIGGMARGLGIAVGATVVFAVVLNFLHQLVECISVGIIFPCFFTPTGVINMPILVKNIQNAI